MITRGPLSPEPPEHLQAACGFEGLSRALRFQKGLVGGLPDGVWGSPEGTLGDALILVEAPRDCKKSPGGAAPPAPRSPPEGLPGCGLDHFKAPRLCCCLKVSRGLPENPLLRRRALERLWGANACKDPSGGARGRAKPPPPSHPSSHSSSPYTRAWAAARPLFRSPSRRVASRRRTGCLPTPPPSQTLLKP